MACSIITVGFAIERLVYFRGSRIDAKSFMRELRGRLRSGSPRGALELCRGKRAALARVMAQALTHLHLEPAQLRDRIATAIEVEQVEMERNLGVLGTMSNIAPLLGLFGTVVGIIRAFADHSAPTYDFLVAHGVTFKERAPDNIGASATGNSAPRENHTVPLQWPLMQTGKPVPERYAGRISAAGYGVGLIRPLEATARKLGVEILLEHRMTGIVRESRDSGRVVGITVDNEGRTFNIRARKGVIVAMTLQEAEAAATDMLSGGVFGDAGATIVVALLST